MPAMDSAQLKAIASRARCLFKEEEVEAALDDMAVSITQVLEELNPVLLCVMNGGLIVTGKLATRLAFPLQLDYLHATRYREQTSGTDLEWKVHPSIPLKQRNVLIVDDILDEGFTLHSINDYCHQQGARSVRSAVLVDKQHARKVPGLNADFTGIEAEDFYLYGYGMDYKGYFRNAPGIYAVDPVDL